MRGPAARFLGIALAAAGVAAAAPVAGSPVTAERYEDGLAAYQRNDFAKALRLLRPLAEKGDARAQYLLGRQYQFGQGVKVNRAEAFYWYKRAEAKGHLEAKLFRQLLEKRWKITAAEKSQAVRKLAAESKPAPHAAHAEARHAPAQLAPVKRTPEIAAKEKPKAAPAKPKIETAHAKLPEAPKPAPVKAKVEIAKTAPPPERSAVVATPNTHAPMEGRPTLPRSSAEIARAAPPTNTGGFDEDEDLPGLYRNGAPPAETRTPVAAAPAPPTAEPPADPPPAGDEYASVPPPSYPPPSYTPRPYYGPAPYYAPAAPPTWRASGYYRPRPAYRPAWGFRPYPRYVHPGWRGAAWRGYRPW